MPSRFQQAPRLCGDFGDGLHRAAGDVHPLDETVARNAMIWLSGDQMGAAGALRPWKLAGLHRVQRPDPEMRRLVDALRPKDEKTPVRRQRRQRGLRVERAVGRRRNREPDGRRRRTDFARWDQRTGAAATSATTAAPSATSSGAAVARGVSCTCGETVGAAAPSLRRSRARFRDLETRHADVGQPVGQRLCQTAPQQPADRGGRPDGTAVQSGSDFRMFANVSDTSSPAKARAPVSIS